LDADVLVRYIAQDDAAQSPKATRLIESLTADNPGFIGLVSLTELVWVLTGCYSSGKAELIAVLEGLLRASGLRVENADTVWKAVRLFKEGNADFADCLIECSASQAGCDYTTTFDRAAAKHCRMRLIA
jgi:predicted nucleic-acid-binding protein